MKCNTNMDVKAIIPCSTRTQLREIQPLEGNLLFCNLIPFSAAEQFLSLIYTFIHFMGK